MKNAERERSSGLSRLTIAGVRFLLSGPNESPAFPLPFQSFRSGDGVTDLGCEVFCSGPDHALALQPPAPDKPWSFTVSEGICEVVRRNQEGVALWQIVGPLLFNRATVSWNPARFSEFYGSYERAWGTGLGLSLLVLRLCRQGGLVFHGAAVDVDGHGVLFLGISGTGKSTLSRLFDAAGATVLTDERPVLRQWPAPGSGEALPAAAFRVYGSPWPSSAGFARNAWAPLRRVYFIEHGETDRVTPLTPREAFNRLIQVATIPWQDPEILDPCLETVGRLLQSMPCAVLSFRPTPAVVEVIRADVCRLAAGAGP